MRFFKLFFLLLLLSISGFSFGMQNQNIDLDITPADKFIFVKSIELNRNNCEAISKNGKYIATVVEEKFVQVIDVETNKQVCSYEHNSVVQCIFFSRCERFVLSGATGGEGIVFDIEKNESFHSYKDKEKRNISYVSLSINAQRVAYGFSCGGIEVFCRKMNKKIFSHKGFHDVYVQPFLNKHGKYVVYQQKENQYSVFGIDAQKQVFSHNIGQRTYLSYTELDDEGRYLVISFVSFPNDSFLHLNIRVFDVIRKEKLSSFRGAYKARLFANLSKDGRYFMLTSCGGEVVVFDTKKKKRVHFYKHKNDFCRAWLSVSDDGQEIISVNKKGQVIKHKTSENFRTSERNYILDKEDKKCRTEFIKKSDSTSEVEDGQEMLNFRIELGGQTLLKSCKSFLTL